jgi:hypothetical protein
MVERENTCRSPEKEPQKERELFCTYCFDYYPEEAIRTVATIDGKSEPVCSDHAFILDELGLAEGSSQSAVVELADSIRNHIQDVTRRSFEFRSVRDLERGL